MSETAPSENPLEDARHKKEGGESASRAATSGAENASAASTRGARNERAADDVARRAARRAISRGAQLSRFFYNALLTAALPALGVYTLWRRHGQRRSRESLRGQWGSLPREALETLRVASTRGAAQNAETDFDAALRRDEEPRGDDEKAASTRAEKKRDATEFAVGFAVVKRDVATPWGGAENAASTREKQKRDAAEQGSATRAAPRIWIHAVSVGECAAARIVARALRAAIPNAILALSTTTDTGQATARAALQAGEVDATFYFPLDALLPVRRALRAVCPDAFLCIETELWPNFLHEARRGGAKTFLVNGRVSDNLLRRAPQLGRLFRWTLSNLDFFLMRSDFDAARLKQLGAPASRLIMTGDVKLDALPSDAENAAARAQWQRVLACENAPLFVAGSTHPGEEELLLSAWKTLRREFPTLRMLLAPRHIERAAEVLQLARRAEPRATLRSQLLEPAKSEIAPLIVLDTIGELAESYAAADVAFVGGSLSERGGHNLLEPVMRGAPVAFGPHVMNFRDAAQWVLAEKIGAQVEGENALAQTLAAWLRDEKTRVEAARNAREKLRENVGAARRVAEIVAREIGAMTVGNRGASTRAE